MKWRAWFRTWPAPHRSEAAIVSAAHSVGASRAAASATRASQPAQEGRRRDAESLTARLRAKNDAWAQTPHPAVAAAEAALDLVEKTR